MPVIYKINNRRDRACAQRSERPRHGRHRAAPEQAERYVSLPFRYAEAHGAVAELVLPTIARTG
ncbi:MAG TPA: hypothetical protein VGE11_19785 [Pseudonocardia sp.]